MTVASDNTEVRKTESQEVRETALASVGALDELYALVTKSASITGDRRGCGRQGCVRTIRTRARVGVMFDIVTHRNDVSARHVPCWLADFLRGSAEVLVSFGRLAEKHFSLCTENFSLQR